MVHMIFGALIASKIQNPFWAVILAFLSHYFLDFIPHNEYPIENMRKGLRKESLPDILRITLDFLSGILLISIFTNMAPVILTAVFFSILPDGFTVLSSVFPNKFLKLHDNLHRKKIHFLKKKKIFAFWKIFSQVSIIIISVSLLI